MGNCLGRSKSKYKMCGTPLMHSAPSSVIDTASNTGEVPSSAASGGAIFGGSDSFFGGPVMKEEQALSTGVMGWMTSDEVLTQAILEPRNAFLDEIINTNSEEDSDSFSA